MIILICGARHTRGLTLLRLIAIELARVINVKTTLIIARESRKRKSRYLLQYGSYSLISMINIYIHLPLLVDQNIFESVSTHLPTLELQ